MILKIFELSVAITLIFTLTADIICQLDNRIMQRIDEKIAAKMHDKTGEDII